VSGEIFRAYIGVSIQGNVIASGKLLDFLKRRELGRFGSDRGRLSARTLLDVVGAEPIMLRRAGKNHEQRLLFLIHLPARLQPDSMDARMTLGNLMETVMIPARLHMGLGARGMTKVVYPIIDRPQTLHTPFLDDQRVP
jgi:hypothetical protein